jgi:hypothetical protein
MFRDRRRPLKEECRGYRRAVGPDLVDIETRWGRSRGGDETKRVSEVTAV